MLRLPLKEPVLLLTTSGKYICKIIYAKEDMIIAVDTVERVFTPNGEILYTDREISGKFTFSRNSISGFKLLSDNGLREDYYNTVAEHNRSQMRLV